MGGGVAVPIACLEKNRWSIVVIVEFPVPLDNLKSGSSRMNYMIVVASLACVNYSVLYV